MLLKCFIHLQGPFHALHKTKEKSHNKHKRSNPERVPLHPIPLAKPSLRKSHGIRFVKGLFQDDESVVPEAEILKPALAGSERATFAQLRIYPGLALGLQPSAGVLIVGRKQLCQCI